MNEGIQICDKNYQANTWEEERRIVIVRQKNRVKDHKPQVSN
ncbi:MAG: hypothetical protein R2774_15070 [Saprospiraceae bacterium]